MHAVCRRAYRKLRTFLWFLFPLWILGISYKFRVKCDTRREVKVLNNYLEHQQQIEPHARLRGPFECNRTFVVCGHGLCQESWEVLVQLQRRSLGSKRDEVCSLSHGTEKQGCGGFAGGGGFCLSVCCIGRKWRVIQFGRVRRLWLWGWRAPE